MKIKLGIVCLTRQTFDYQTAGKIYQDIREKLERRLDLSLVTVPDTIETATQAEQAGKMFHREQVDCVAIISGTFHLGHLVLEIKKWCDAPLLLWGLPELPYDGGKIRLNSVCGVNLNASNLVKSGINDFVYHIGEDIDENFLDAVRIIAALKSAKIGLLGSHAHGFFNVGMDQLKAYKKFGVGIEHFELEEVFKYPFLNEEKDLFLKLIKENFENKEHKNAEKVAELSAKLKFFMDNHALSGLAIRCWPEFAEGFGIAPCASMSLVQSLGYILACEGDIDCAITMIAHKAVGAETPFMADISQADIKENTALMWHCGVAPCNLKDSECTLDDYHAGGKGMTAGFVLKKGFVDMTRLDSISGEYRLFHERGEAVRMPKLLTGSYAKVRFENSLKDVLDKVIYSGVAHHVSVVYGDYTRAFEIFCRLKDIKVL